MRTPFLPLCTELAMTCKKIINPRYTTTFLMSIFTCGESLRLSRIRCAWLARYCLDVAIPWVDTIYSDVQISHIYARAPLYSGISTSHIVISEMWRQRTCWARCTSSRGKPAFTAQWYPWLCKHLPCVPFHVWLFVYFYQAHSNGSTGFKGDAGRGAQDGHLNKTVEKDQVIRRVLRNVVKICALRLSLWFCCILRHHLFHSCNVRNASDLR